MSFFENIPYSWYGRKYQQNEMNRTLIKLYIVLLFSIVFSDNLVRLVIRLLPEISTDWLKVSIDIVCHALLTLPVLYIFARQPLYELYRQFSERSAMAESTYYKLIETNEYLSNLFNYANVPIIVWDTSLKITQFNASFEQLTGYAQMEVIGQPIDLLFPPALKKQSLDQIAQTSSGGRMDSVEIKILCKSGAIRTLLWNSANILTKERDTISATIAQGYDITVRLKALESLADSNALLSALLQYSPIYVFVKEVGPAENRVLKVSDNFVNIVGIPAGDMIGRTMQELFPKNFAEKIIADDWYVFQTGKDLIIEEHLNGRTYTTIKFPFMIGDKKVLGGFTIDVTEKEEAIKQTNATLASLTVIEKELREKNTELERFTYTVSHDLKSPLITIKGYAGGLLKDIAKGRTDRLQSDLQRISSAADKMTGLLEDLLQLSRIGRVINPPTEFSLNGVVEDVLEVLQGPIQEAAISIQTGTLPLVRADRSRILEVFQNLVENSVKFTRGRSDPCIEIGQMVKDGESVIYVKDNGRGIDPRYQETIFGLFNKLDAETSGSGIGLALVRRIVEVHNGRVWAESQGVDTGVTIYLTLPFIHTS